MNTTTKKQEVLYDPAAQRLVFMRAGKMIGGMIGNVAEKHFNELLDSGTIIKMTAMSEKKQKTRRLRAIWIRQGIDDYRKDIIHPYGVSSTADLSESQLDELIRKYTNRVDAPYEIRKERSVVIKLLQGLGIYKNDDDWTRVNEYMMDSRICGKLLYELNVVELKALAVKLRAIENKQNKDNIRNN